METPCWTRTQQLHNGGQTIAGYFVKEWSRKPFKCLAAPLPEAFAAFCRIQDAFQRTFLVAAESNVRWPHASQRLLPEAFAAFCKILGAFQELFLVAAPLSAQTLNLQIISYTLPRRCFERPLSSNAKWRTFRVS